MSYPALIQPLVIEDEPEIKVAYEAIFDSLSKRYALAPSCYAFCYDDAVKYLSSNTIFHLVILDLRLPKSPGLPALAGIDLGEDLLGTCAKREQYPIPSLLIVSAHVGKADQEQLKSAVEFGFAHGRVLVKGDYSMLEAEIERAVQAIQRYCGIGIHLRDAGEDMYPTLTPRDEDLLRRVLLERTGAIGVDLEWWSASASRAFDSIATEWTKVLMGRMLLDKGDRPSRPKFFKLLPSPRGASVIETVRRMEDKLSHIKVNGVKSSSGTALIVTEKVGNSETRPTSLNDFLALPNTSIGDLARIASQIVAQIEVLGTRGPQTKALRALLWRCHNKKRIAEAWNSYGGEGIAKTLGINIDALELFEKLSESDVQVRIEQQSFLHGDLHLDNVALDLPPTGVEAYIFDAGGTEPSVSFRDIVMLEVTALLHQDISEVDFVAMCRELYSISQFVPDTLCLGMRPVASNTYDLIRLLRTAVSATVDSSVFALMIFDSTLIQLGGLVFGASASKVRHPRNAAVLSAFAAQWYENQHVT